MTRPTRPTDAQTPPCHPNPDLRGGARGCPYIEPCTQRCHIRWLDGDDQLANNLTRLADTPRPAQH
ncbi:hypothetical protein [Micromonospora sp. NBRC 101691]|uniref:hypothetical protein n=1 Tax=Micromonospora sp. NBRC 101691 TaxID=3032198 RepID=UPI0024A1FCAF|nr:hypothetical protein [Micromonospora sp. NBRC 101691]GLY24830.1 hypothetical protein Misp04_45620 [Micromonospora sp. NBRC 101691]